MSKGKARNVVGFEKNSKIILAVGRIEPLKGFDALLYALKILLVRRPELKDQLNLWIIGGDTSEPVNLWSGELKHLERLKRELGLTARVKFVGKKTQKELRYFYSAADIVVMPSHYESFGMVALEAMACGTPVIISNVSGGADLINSNRGGLITTVNNPLLLAEQIEDLISVKPGRTVQKKGYNPTKKFTWRKTSLSLAKVYKNA